MIADCKNIYKNVEEYPQKKGFFSDTSSRFSSLSDDGRINPSFFKQKIGAFLKNFQSLKNGWADNEDNKEFSLAFLKRIEIFLENLFDRVKVSGYTLHFPVISPVDGNSIDIHWKTDEFQLLINISEFETNENCSAIYGRTFDYSTEINFHFKFDYIQGIIWEWLKIIL